MMHELVYLQNMCFNNFLKNKLVRLKCLNNQDYIFCVLWRLKNPGVFFIL